MGQVNILKIDKGIVRLIQIEGCFLEVGTYVQIG